MINQEIKASPELRTFFEKLLSLKKKVAYYKEETEDKILTEIYTDLDGIIQEAIE